MSLCESSAPITLATGGCKSQGRWVGPDGKVRCSMHQIQEFGHAEPLVRVEGYKAPRTPTKRGSRKRVATKEATK